MRSVNVVGVHPVDDADQPCHLIELDVRDSGRDFNMDDVVQANEEVSKNLWQLAYDERFLDAQSLQPLHESHKRPDRDAYRVAFFLHYLDLAKPLETSFGPLTLPPPSPRPGHLAFMAYMPPD